MYVFQFVLWCRKTLQSSDIAVKASSVGEAVEIVGPLESQYIIGDCRHCAVT